MSYICNYYKYLYVKNSDMRLKSLDKRIKYRIARSKDNVFVPKDFFDLSGRDQVGRALRQLIKDGDLVKIGYGLYAKATYSEFSNRIIPARPLSWLAKEAMEKLGVTTAQTKYERMYNEGSSTQVPTGRVIGVKNRVSRKISFEGSDIAYEYVP